ncbi:MAG: LPS export ABC transporter periplasmic protein LptC [Candidatus Neomarinimicrobiota bacterium]|nr:MAG: LPS export ABC transporter periplasmic protein LptC [Candidatus Neomarinimicrobiota bacterium]
MSKLRFSLYLLAVFIFVACSEQKNQMGVSAKLDLPEQESWNAKITLLKENLKRASVNAGHLVKFSEKDLIVMDEGVAVDFFDAEGKHLSYLESDSAIIIEKTSDMIAKGDVTVISDNGATLYTEELRWDHKREKVVSDVDVIFITEKDTLRGKGFESNADLTEWVIRQPVGVSEREIKVE